MTQPVSRPWPVVVVAAVFAVCTLALAAALIPGVSKHDLPDHEVFVLIGVLNLLATGLFNYAIYAGHNWARIIVLIGCGVSLFKVLFALVLGVAIESRAMPTFVATVLWLGGPLALGTLLMLPATRAWYRQQSAR